MTLTFLHTRSYQRQLYIDEVPARREMSAVILETRLLGLLACLRGFRRERINGRHFALEGWGHQRIDLSLAPPAWVPRMRSEPSALRRR